MTALSRSAYASHIKPLVLQLARSPFEINCTRSEGKVLIQHEALVYALVKYMYFGSNLAVNKNPAIQTYYTALSIEEHEAFWSLYS